MLDGATQRAQRAKPLGRAPVFAQRNGTRLRNQCARVEEQSGGGARRKGAKAWATGGRVRGADPVERARVVVVVLVVVVVVAVVVVVVVERARDEDGEDGGLPGEVLSVPVENQRTQSTAAGQRRRRRRRLTDIIDQLKERGRRWGGGGVGRGCREGRRRKGATAAGEAEAGDSNATASGRGVWAVVRRRDVVVFVCFGWASWDAASVSSD